MANLKLKLLDTFLDADDVLFKGGLVVLELSDLLLKSGSLSSLVSVVTLDLLLDTMKLVCEGLAGVRLLHGEYGFESLLLATEDLHLLLVSVQLLLQLSHSVIEVVQLSLEVSCVVGALTSSHCR